MSKRIISMLLIIAMISSIFPMAAMAVEDTGISETGNPVQETQTLVNSGEEALTEGNDTLETSPIVQETSESDSPLPAETVVDPSEPELELGAEVDPFTDAGADLLNGISPEAEIDATAVLPSAGAVEVDLDTAEEGGNKVQRDIVLMLDISDSMQGVPFTTMKKAAEKFCEQLLKAEGDNRIALVVWDYNYTTHAFSGDIETVKETIQRINLGGGTNTAQALTVAKNLMDESARESAVKNIVLLTDGIPQHGSTTNNGPYTSSDSQYYTYANSAYNAAVEITAEYYLYTLGFFHNLTGSKLEFGQRFLRDIQNAGYYEVINPEELEFVFGEVVEDIENKTSEIQFTYQSGSDYTATCYFNQDYFSEFADGCVDKYRPSLATMSLSLAMSAFASGDEKDYAKKSVNAQNLLKDIAEAINSEVTIGTNDWYTVKPTTDSIGVIVGSMPIKVDGNKETLIAIAVRGKGYDSEWASNFTIGRTGQHQGFDAAKNEVLRYVKQFISENSISGDVKLWITGFSRAAATANLVGGAILDGEQLGSDIVYTADDVFTYCFETPAGALTSKVKGNSKYNNIFNIINSNDPVPYVAPAGLGFARYGIDKYLPSPATNPKNYSSLKTAMLEIYNALDSTDGYCVDDFQMKKIAMKNWLPGGNKISFIQDDTKNNFSQAVYLSNYVSIITKEFLRSRDNYVDNYQNQIREICSIVFGCTGKQSDKLMESFVDQAKENWGDLVTSYVWNVGVNPWGSEDDALQVVSNWLLKAVKDAGIEDYSEAMVNSAGLQLADLLLALIANHPNYATTLIANIKSIGAAHYPELCFAWVASMDPNYSGDGPTSDPNDAFNNGSYRIIRINCEVDVDVYDSDGALVASITADTPEAVGDSTIISAINEDGEKIVVLPATETYSFGITGREADTVNVGIDEYCASMSDFTRSVDYFNIPIEAGETLTGYAPTYTEEEITNSTPEGSGAQYALFDANNQEIEVGSNLTGVQATTAYYMVSVASSNETYGIATGSGLRQYGNYAQIEAVASEGCAFLGWYVDDVLVSTDVLYRFPVTEDIELVGKFESLGNNITRLYGDDRYRTAIKIAEELKATWGVEKFDTIVVASGEDFPDALAGTYLASVVKAPIVLNSKAGYSFIAEYIQENLVDNGKIYLLGGTAALQESVETRMKKITPHVVRLAGSDRYATCMEILREAENYDTATEVMICSGVSYTDTLVASATTNPVLLVYGGASMLNQNQKAYLAGKIHTIVGDENTVGTRMAAALKKVSSFNGRIAGDSCVTTSIAVAENYFWTPETAVLASGKDYPDGLCGGVLAIAKQAPLLLVADQDAAIADYVANYNIQTGIVVGGTAAVSKDSVITIFGGIEPEAGN